MRVALLFATCIVALPHPYGWGYELARSSGPRVLRAGYVFQRPDKDQRSPHLAFAPRRLAFFIGASSYIASITVAQTHAGYPRSGGPRQCLARPVRAGRTVSPPRSPRARPPAGPDVGHPDAGVSSYSIP